MRILSALVILSLAGNAGVIVWAVNKQPGPQLICPVQIKKRGYWWVDYAPEGIGPFYTGQGI